MSKNKIIFLVFLVVIIVGFVFILALLSKSSDDNNAKSRGDFVIWTYNLEKEKMQEFIKDFKSANTKYEKKNIVVENFSNYYDYKQTLISSFLSNQAPDVFLLNNSEKSYLDNQVIGINPDLLNPNDFRKRFKTFISNDLIRESKGDDGKTVEFVAGIPVGFETLGIYYNKKFNIKSTDLNSWSSVSNLINDLVKNNQGIVPLGVSDYKNSKIISDLISQFFLLSSDTNTFKSISDNVIKEGFENFYSYFDYKNYYNNNEESMYAGENNKKTNLELFSEGKEAMIVGYPSMLNDLRELGFNKSLLGVEAFPHYYVGKGNILSRYSYFVVNKKSRDEKLAFDFLFYLGSEAGAEKFLNKFTFLLPALDNLERKYLDNQVNNSYYVLLRDFFKGDYQTLLSSFDKIIDDIYDEEISNIVIYKSSYIDKVKNLQKNLECKYNKVYHFNDLSNDCENL